MCEGNYIMRQVGPNSWREDNLMDKEWRDWLISDLGVRGPICPYFLVHNKYTLFLTKYEVYTKLKPVLNFIFQLQTQTQQENDLKSYDITHGYVRSKTTTIKKK